MESINNSTIMQLSRILSDRKNKHIYDYDKENKRSERLKKAGCEHPEDYEYCLKFFCDFLRDMDIEFLFSIIDIGIPSFVKGQPIFDDENKYLNNKKEIFHFLKKLNNFRKEIEKSVEDSLKAYEQDNKWIYPELNINELWVRDDQIGYLYIIKNEFCLVLCVKISGFFLGGLNIDVPHEIQFDINSITFMDFLNTANYIKSFILNNAILHELSRLFGWVFEDFIKKAGFIEERIFEYEADNNFLASLSPHQQKLEDIYRCVFNEQMSKVDEHISYIIRHIEDFYKKHNIFVDLRKLPEYERWLFEIQNSKKLIYQKIINDYLLKYHQDIGTENYHLPFWFQDFYCFLSPEDQLLLDQLSIKKNIPEVDIFQIVYLLKKFRLKKQIYIYEDSFFGCIDSLKTQEGSGCIVKNDQIIVNMKKIIKSYNKIHKLSESEKMHLLRNKNIQKKLLQKNKTDKDSRIPLNDVIEILQEDRLLKNYLGMWSSAFFDRSNNTNDLWNYSDLKEELMLSERFISAPKNTCWIFKNTEEEHKIIKD